MKIAKIPGMFFAFYKFNENSYKATIPVSFRMRFTHDAILKCALYSIFSYVYEKSIMWETYKDIRFLFLVVALSKTRRKILLCKRCWQSDILLSVFVEISVFCFFSNPYSLRSPSVKQFVSHAFGIFYLKFCVWKPGAF